MGMYTGLRCKVKLKDEFVPVISKLIDLHSWKNLGYDFLDDFEEYSRSNAIPFGTLCYMPDSWETEEEEKEWELRVDNGLWIFQCSLKDYNNTIQYFFVNVLPKISESSQHIEVLYEEWDTPIMLEIYNGSVTKIDEKIEILSLF